MLFIRIEVLIETLLIDKEFLELKPASTHANSGVVRFECRVFIFHLLAQETTP